MFKSDTEIILLSYSILIIWNSKSTYLKIKIICEIKVFFKYPDI